MTRRLRGLPSSLGPPVAAAALLVAAAFVLVATGKGAPIQPAAAQEAGGVTLTLLHNGDGESALLPLTNTVEVEGARTEVPVGGIAAYRAVADREIAEARARGNAVLTVYAGDAYLSVAAFACSEFEGNPLFDAVAQDAIPYDAHILGNHEFDRGPDLLERFIRAFDGQPFLSANLDFSGEPGFADLLDADGLIDGAVEDGRVVGRSMIVTDEVTGVRFGLVGATTPGLPVISVPRKVTVTPDVATTAVAVQAEVDRLLAQGVDRVILVSHLQHIGIDIELIGLLRGVDVAVAGGGDDLLHSPAVDASRQLLPGERAEVQGAYPIEATDADGRTVYLVTAPGNYQYVGRIDVRFDAAGEVIGVVAEASYPRPVVPSTEAATAAGFAAAVEPDVALLDAVERPVAECLAGLATTRIATTEVLIDVSRAAVRTRGGNGGNLVTDAFLHSYDRFAADFGLPARRPDHPVVALQNGGGIRQNAGDVLPTSGSVPGDIVLVNTLDVLPFGNGVTVIPGVTPADLKAAFELSISRYPAASGGFLHVAGMTVVYDPAREVGSRVVEITLEDGRAIVSDGAVAAGAPSVTVVTNSFTAGGGDGYAMLKDYDVQIPLPTSYERALRDYLASLGTISASDARYASGGEARIMFLAATKSADGQPDAPRAGAGGAATDSSPGTPGLHVVLAALLALALTAGVRLAAHRR